MPASEKPKAPSICRVGSGGRVPWWIWGVAVAYSLAIHAAAFGATPEEIQRAIEAAKAELRPAPPSVGTTPTPPVGPEASDLAADAQAPTSGRRPAGVLTADDLPPGQQPTPMEGVAAALKLLNPPPDRLFYDFGSGFDARVPIRAALDYGVQQCIGLEIDPIVAESSRAYVAHAGLTGQVDIRTGDASKASINGGYGFSYNWPEVLAKFRPQIEKLDRFVSYGFPVPGLNMKHSKAPNGGDLYLWVSPITTNPSSGNGLSAPDGPQTITPQFTQVPVYQRVRVPGYVKLPPGSTCYCNKGSRCPNPMAHKYAQQLVGYRNVPIAPNSNSAAAIAPTPQQGATRPATQQVAPRGRWVTVPVKRCNGRQCWYEMQQKWVPN